MISMAGVAIGVAVLIVVLSVMNGFERELRARILSLTSHATITAFGDGLAGLARRCGRDARAQPGVAAVAPFVEAEALLIADRHGRHDECRNAARHRCRRLRAHASPRVGDRLTLRLGSRRCSPARSASFSARSSRGKLRVQVGDSVVVRRGAGQRDAGRRRAAHAPVQGRAASSVRHVRDRRYAGARAPRRCRAPAAARRQRHAACGSKLSDPFEAPLAVREVASALGGGLYVDDWTQRACELLPLDRADEAHDVLHPAAGRGGGRVQHRLDARHGGEGQAPGHRHPAHASAPGRASILAIFTTQGIVIGLLGTLAGVLLGVLIAVNLEVARARPRSACSACTFWMRACTS